MDSAVVFVLVDLYGRVWQRIACRHQYGSASLVDISMAAHQFVQALNNSCHMIQFTPCPGNAALPACPLLTIATSVKKHGASAEVEPPVDATSWRPCAAISSEACDANGTRVGQTLMHRK
eukprot:353600-Chlamydomonas_euryale.AAC.5